MSLADKVQMVGTGEFNPTSANPEAASTIAALLKNAGGVLHLTGPGKTIAVIGPAANQAGATLAEQGYGSGHVPEFAYQPGVVSPLQAITTTSRSCS